MILIQRQVKSLYCAANKLQSKALWISALLQNLLCAALKFRKINCLLQNSGKLIACFKIQEKCLGFDLMINALQSNSLHAYVTFVCQCASLSDSSFTSLFLLVGCLPQRFDVRMLSFLSHQWIPELLWVND